MNDELTAAMERLLTPGMESVYETDQHRSDRLVLLAALERALPLLPLLDVIERLEKNNYWAVELRRGNRYIDWEHSEIFYSAIAAAGPERAEQIANLGGKTWPDAIRALAQVLESEAKT